MKLRIRNFQTALDMILQINFVTSGESTVSLGTNVLPLTACCLLLFVFSEVSQKKWKSGHLAEEIVAFAIDVYLLMVGKDSIRQSTDVLRSREQQ